MGVGGECDAPATLLSGMIRYPLYRRVGWPQDSPRKCPDQIWGPGTGGFFPGKSGGALKSPTHLHLTAGLEMSGAVLVFPQYAFMV